MILRPGSGSRFIGNTLRNRHQILPSATTKYKYQLRGFSRNSNCSKMSGEYWLPLKCLLYTSSADSLHTVPTHPSNLPVPVDDGACDHLSNKSIPSDLSLPSTGTQGSRVTISALSGLTILFCYPRTARPDETIPPEWDAIPGARGCTPQACSFRDNLPRLTALGVDHIFGVSVQDTAYQQEVDDRLGLKYQLLSDSDFRLQGALQLPTFEWREGKLLRRVTLAIKGGRVVKWWYPVFPSDNIDPVLEWLESKD